MWEAGVGAASRWDPLSASHETELAFENTEPQDLYWPFVVQPWLGAWPRGRDIMSVV